jgi:ribosomal peptide maturation radical SAM protein 1
MKDSNLDVQLIVMPFGTVKEPTIGVSLLKAGAVQAGFSSQIKYFSLNFAERIGLNAYYQIIKKLASRSLVGDWIFSEALFRDQTPDTKEYERHILEDYSRWVDDVPYGIDFGKDRNLLDYLEDTYLPGIKKVRELASDFVDWCVGEIMRYSPRVVGFSSSSHQACSCLAVARRLKETASPPVIVFGGANCHGEMGYQWIQSFPWIDFICIGEGDHIFPDFLTRLLKNGDSRPPPGILKQGEEPESILPEVVVDLDSIPMPDYSDYFEQLERSPLKTEVGLPLLPIEMSRGCWWGEKEQCVFCGNNARMITYRSKSPVSIVEEIKSQTKKKSYSQIICVDDTLSKKHINSVFPQLQKKRLMLPIFCQTRPDLKRHELIRLRNGGVRVIQPGIESLSDQVLRIMHKGRTGFQNIWLLRQCLELGIWTTWNILYGFAGESLTEYEYQKNLIPLLIHLHPPLGCGLFALKRFSPYWLCPENFGLINVFPWQSYDAVYPLDCKEIENMAYFFDFDYPDGKKPFEYSRGLRLEVGRWIEAWQLPPEERPVLKLISKGKELTITDTRPCAVQSKHKLEGLSAEIYCLCDEVQRLRGLRNKLGNRASENDIYENLEKMKERKILVEKDGAFLALAVAENLSD